MFRSRKGSVDPRPLCALVALAVVLSSYGSLFGSEIGPLSPAPSAPSAPCATASCDGLPASVRPAYFNQVLAFGWANATSPAEPAGAGAGLFADPAGGGAVLFGGETTLTLSNVTQYYNQSENRWSIPTSGPAPSPRAFFASAGDPTDRTGVVFGGLVNASSNAVDNSTWVYDATPVGGVPDTGSWTNVTESVAPPARESAAFAIDPTGDFGLLFGGTNPDYTPSSSITYNDLWRLDLSTDAWSRVALNSSLTPPPLAGASLTWDPVSATFDLFGGCYPCTSAVWAYDPATDLWSEFPTPSGNAPDPRADAAWAWEPVDGADLLFGGTNGVNFFNDTREFLPANDSWTDLYTPRHPGPRYSAAVAWLNTSGNETLLLSGGRGTASDATDLWRLAPTSTIALQVLNESDGQPVPGASVLVDGIGPYYTSANGSFGSAQITSAMTTVNVTAVGYAASQVSFWLPPKVEWPVAVKLTPVAPTDLVVTIVNPAGAAVPGVLVNVSVGNTLVDGSPRITGASGALNFTDVPSGIPSPTATVTAWAPLNYTATDTLPLVSGARTAVPLQLTPYPFLEVHVIGTLANETRVNVGGAQVDVDSAEFGSTDAAGWTNGTTPYPNDVVLVVSAAGFRSADPSVTLPHTGPVVETVDLTGVPFGAFLVTVLDAQTLVPLTGASVYALPLPGQPGVTLPIVGLTSIDGMVTLAVPAGRYNLSAEEYGYYPNETATPFDVASGQTVPVTFHLRLLPGATVNVLVHANNNQSAIDGARVTMGSLGPTFTDRAGWTNYTNVHFGLTDVNVSAAGYDPNDTLVELAPYQLLPELLVNLTPVTVGHGSTNSSATPNPFSGFTTAVAQVAPYLVLLVVLVVGVSVYLLSLRVRGSERRPAVSLGRGPPTPPGEASPPTAVRELPR